MPISLLASTGVAATGPEYVTTPSIDTSGASFLAVFVSNGDWGGAIGITDSENNLWSQLASQGISGATQGTLFFCSSPKTSAIHTVSTAGNNNYPSVCFAAFGGTGAASLDKQNGAASAATGVMSFQPGAIVTRFDGELIVTGIAFNAIGVLSISAGFSIAQQFDFTPGSNFGSALAWGVQAAAGSINPTWTASGGGTSDPAAVIGGFAGTRPSFAQVSQSALDIITLSNPNARVFQSAIDIITVPAVIGVQVILRGVKRYRELTALELSEAPEVLHVDKAV